MNVSDVNCPNENDGTTMPVINDIREWTQDRINLPQETEVTSTPTRPVENVVLTTKGLQDRNNNC